MLADRFGVTGAEIEVGEASGSAGRFVILTARDVDYSGVDEFGNGPAFATAALDRRDTEALRDHLTDVLERW